MPAFVALAVAATLSLAPTKIDRSVPGVVTAKAELPSLRSNQPVERRAAAALRELATKRLDAFVAKAKREVPPINRQRGYPMGYEMLIEARMATQRPSLVSGVVLTYKFTLGAHGNTSIEGFTFFMNRGQVRQLSLSDVFQSGDGLAECSMLLVQQLVRGRRAPWIDMGLSGDIDASKHGWALEPSGIHFYIQPMTVAPYSSGIIEAVVPYKDFVHPLKAGVLAALK